MINNTYLKQLLLILFISLFSVQQLFAQEEYKGLKQYIIKCDSLNSTELINFLSSKIALSQFVMVGEQHGIKAAGDFTNLIYNIAQPFDYRYLCIETDATAAKIIAQSAGNDNLAQALKKHYESFPDAIPFYDNYNDYKLLNNVIASNGEIWGIDQTYMVQFRSNFDYLESTTSNPHLKEEISKLKELAIAAYEKAIKEKDLMAVYIFQYSDELHNKLIKLTQEDTEKEILYQFKKTKEIYSHYLNGENYVSCLKRSKLMKRNFLNYYEEATSTGKLPKVIFKLGANHIPRGLNATNVYDISNLASELSFTNNMESTHVYLSGINGESTIAKPFAPASKSAFDYTKNFPKEIQTAIADLENKYLVLDLVPLRTSASEYSNELQDWIFKYDIIVLVKDALPLTTF